LLGSAVPVIRPDALAKTRIALYLAEPSLCSFMLTAEATISNRTVLARFGRTNPRVGQRAIRQNEPKAAFAERSNWQNEPTAEACREESRSAERSQLPTAERN
jgi:hypothetical protein